LIINRDIEDSDRGMIALSLLESSGYDEPWRESIADEINSGSPDEIELIIEDLLLNQVDRQSSYRLKDINRRIDRHDKRT